MHWLGDPPPALGLCNHCSTLLASAEPRNQCLRRLCGDSEIEKQAAVFQVVQVVGQLLFCSANGPCIAPANLSPARDARLRQVTSRPEWNLFREQTKELWALRSGSDNAHLATEDVQKLGKLVEASAPEDPSDTSDSRIALDRPNGSILLFGTAEHRPELEHVEGLTVFTEATLPVYDRAGSGHPHRDRRHQ